jgi:uncharacterized protein YxeA
MKKIITFLFCIALISSAFAQTNRHDRDDETNNPYWNSNNNQRSNQRNWNKDNDDKNYGYNRNVYQRSQNDNRDRQFPVNNGGYQNNNYSTSQRDMQIQRISNQYDSRIQQIYYDRTLNNRQKEYAIQTLQAQKAQQLNAIYSQYSNNNNTYNNDGYGSNNNYRHGQQRYKK